MQISKLLQEDKRVQELIINLSCTLKEDECLFALTVWGAINFKKVKIKNKNRFRRLNWMFNPVYITSFPLRDIEEVNLIGMLIRDMNREKEAIYYNN